MIEPDLSTKIMSKTKNSNNISESKFCLSSICKKRDYFCKNQQNFIK